MTNEANKKSADTLYCWACKKEIGPANRFCPHCGAMVRGSSFGGTFIKCSTCYKPISSDVEFCPNCGANVARAIVNTLAVGNGSSSSTIDAHLPKEEPQEQFAPPSANSQPEQKPDKKYEQQQASQNAVAKELTSTALSGSAPYSMADAKAPKEEPKKQSSKSNDVTSIGSSSAAAATASGSSSAIAANQSHKKPQAHQAAESDNFQANQNFNERPKEVESTYDVVDIGFAVFLLLGLVYYVTTYGLGRTIDGIQADICSHFSQTWPCGGDNKILGFVIAFGIMAGVGYAIKVLVKAVTEMTRTKETKMQPTLPNDDSQTDQTKIAKVTVAGKTSDKGPLIILGAIILLLIGGVIISTINQEKYSQTTTTQTNRLISQQRFEYDQQRQDQNRRDFERSGIEMQQEHDRNMRAIHQD
jgi:RNA polymerase subunit RPABC4/transcription elongation factor Spt4